MVESNIPEKVTKSRHQSGFSLIELLTVVALMMIATGVAYYYLSAHQDLYKADEQALIISDVFQEARQRSLTQRETIRVEIDLTDNIVRLYDENSPSTVNDDTEIRSISLLNSADVRIDERPGQISVNPRRGIPRPVSAVRPEYLSKQSRTRRLYRPLPE